MTVREIAEEIGIGKSAVHRMKQRIDREATEEEAGRTSANSRQRRCPLSPGLDEGTRGRGAERWARHPCRAWGTTTAGI